MCYGFRIFLVISNKSFLISWKSDEGFCFLRGLGSANLWIAFTLRRFIFIPFLIIKWPKYAFSFLKKCHLSGRILRFALRNLSKVSLILMSIYVFVYCLIFLSTKGICKNLLWAFSTMNADMSMSCGSISSCWNPDVQW